jgi:hypothetical protein
VKRRYRTEGTASRGFFEKKISKVQFVKYMQRLGTIRHRFDLGENHPPQETLHMRVVRVGKTAIEKTLNDGGLVSLERGYQGRWFVYSNRLRIPSRTFNSRHTALRYYQGIR